MREFIVSGSFFAKNDYTRKPRMPAKPPAPPPRFAVAALLLGASLWGVIWYPMRRLEAEGLSGIWLTFVLYAAALAVSLPRTAGALRELGRDPVHMGALMLAAGWTNIAFVEAVLAGNILRVLLLFYLAPLWATLIGWFLLHERPARLGLASLALAMTGALVMLWDARIGLPWPASLADWYALSSGMAFAASMAVTRKAQHLSIEAKVFAVFAGVSALAAVIILGARIALPPAAPAVYLGAAALGVFGILLMTALVQYGVTHMPVYRASVLALIELVAGAVSQQLLTEEVVTVREWLGGALIVAGAYLAARAKVETGSAPRPARAPPS
jgi:drug/metabolite transporter (DMT)-like permease